MKLKSNRPKWARKLRASEWNHLKEGQDRRQPTLANLRVDAETCKECAWILRSLEKSVTP